MSPSFNPFVAHSRHAYDTKPDILCLQETHASSLDVQTRLDIQLQASASIWTSHCGIVSLNSNVLIDPIFTSDDGRVIYCSVSHTTNLFPTLTIMNIYAPASRADRCVFYDQLLQQPYFQTLLRAMSAANPPDYLSTIPDVPSMILGDFNYNLRRCRPPVPTAGPSIESQWLFHAMLTHHYKEGTHGLCKDPMIPTFRRENSFTTIDYFFVDPQLMEFRTNQFVHFVHAEWTDHALLSMQLTFADPNLGKGLW